jgi:hypothetical protein
MNEIIGENITLFVDYDNLPICHKVFCFKFTYCVKNYLSLTRLKGKPRYLPLFKVDRSYVAQGSGSMQMHKNAYLVVVNNKELSTQVVEPGKTLTPYLGI